MFRRRLTEMKDPRPAVSGSSYRRRGVEDARVLDGELALGGQDIASISNGTSLQRFWNRGRR